MNPTDDELHAFVAAMLSNLDARLRAPEVIAETIRDHRDMWVMLLRASVDVDERDDASGREA